ncbi:putative carboxylesterase protein, partial [Corchorus capsularis]
AQACPWLGPISNDFIVINIIVVEHGPVIPRPNSLSGHGKGLLGGMLPRPKFELTNG